MPRGVVPKRVTQDREARVQRVAELDRRGWTLQRIARELGVSVPQASDDLKVAVGWYKEQAGADLAAKVERACAALMDVRAEAWDAWVRSCEDAVTFTQEKAPALPEDDADDPTLPPREGPGEPRTPPLKEIHPVVKVTTRRVGPAGDPRFLSIIKETIAEEARLRGLYPDPKAGGGSVTVEGGKDFWDKFLDAFAAPGP